jgi:hypothetical protein
MAVEQDAPPMSDPRKRLRREVAPQQGSNVNPFHPPEGAFRFIAVAPWLTDRLDAHLPAAVGVVVEGEGRRLAGGCERDRNPERRQTTEIRAPVRLAAFRDDDRLLRQRVDGARGVPWASADSWLAAADDVTRKRADDGERPHDRQA